MGNLRKNASDKLGIFENVLGSLDKVFGSSAPYKGGQKAGKGLSNIIDKMVDKVLPK